MAEEAITVDVVIQQLADRRADALTTLELLDGLRAQVDEDRTALEDPQAVGDYLTFFRDFISTATVECGRITAELSAGPQPAHAAALRQLAAASAAEQRRCLLFRDKSINKPLPHERLRPLLNVEFATMDWATARALERAGHKCAAHSLTHPWLAKA